MSITVLFTTRQYLTRQYMRESRRNWEVFQKPSSWPQLAPPSTWPAAAGRRSTHKRALTCPDGLRTYETP